MKHIHVHTSGLRPTLRHLQYLVAASAVAVYVGPWLANPNGAIAWPRALAWALAACLVPAVFGVLVLLFDRPGPARDWMLGMTGTILLTALVIVLDGVVLARNRMYHELIGLLVLLNLGVGFWFVRNASALWPRFCPVCGRRAVVAGLNWVRSRHNDPSEWARCAACDTDFDREMFRRTPPASPTRNLD